MSRPRSWVHLVLATGLALGALQIDPCAARALSISPKGRHLARVLDGMNVEQRWLPGDGVNWRTGEHDPAARALKGHCSAFAAAVCAAFDLYILRPPDHREWLLANAQCAWLLEEGPRHGWARIEDGASAQRLANRGNLVLACYKNRERDDPGHIAVIRPSGKSLKRINREGPDVTQAGSRNYRRTTARVGFRLHARAWARGEIVYYWHPIP